MSSPRKGPAGRSIHLEQARENEIYSGDELYVVWTGPLVTRSASGTTHATGQYSVGDNAPGFSRNGKSGLKAWIIKQELVARRNLWSLLGAGDVRRTLGVGKPVTVADLQKDADLLDFLATHVHEVEIATGANADVIHTIPKPDRCWVRADTNERRLHVGIIVAKPDKDVIGYRGVPIGATPRDSLNGRSASATGGRVGGDPASAGSPIEILKAKIRADIALMGQGETVYGRSGTGVKVPYSTDTIVTDNDTHQTAIRITPDYVSVDVSGQASNYKLNGQLNPGRFK